MNLDLEDKVVVIMGGSSGVGLKTAETFLKEGAKVAICGRNKERLDDANNYLLGFSNSNNILALSCDVTIKSDIFEFIEKVVAKFDGIDVLVNSAGHSVMGHFFDITDEQWETQIKLKYYAIIHAVQAVHPYFKVRGEGRIININATLSKEPEQHMIATAATRAGLLNLSRTLSRELAEDNILVNSVSLGLIKTDQWERRRLKGDPDMAPEKYYENLAKDRGIPLNRVGEVEEVADVIVFLASKRASYVAGSTIEVAGALGKSI